MTKKIQAKNDDELNKISVEIPEDVYYIAKAVAIKRGKSVESIVAAILNRSLVQLLAL